jgi:hypothetical protein
MLTLLFNALAFLSGLVFGWGMVIRGIEKAWSFPKIVLTTLVLGFAMVCVGILVPPLVYYLFL